MTDNRRLWVISVCALLRTEDDTSTQYARAMLLHVYTTQFPTYEHLTHFSHVGSGFGSIFGRLFSRVISGAARSGVKAVAKNALKTDVRLGSKALKSAVKHTAPIVKELAKEGLSTATQIGAEKAIQEIHRIAEKGAKAGAPESLTSTLSKVAEEGARAVKSRVDNSLGAVVDSLASAAVKKATPTTTPPGPPHRPKNHRPGTGVKRTRPQGTTHRGQKKKKKSTQNLLYEL